MLHITSCHEFVLLIRIILKLKYTEEEAYQLLECLEREESLMWKVLNEWLPKHARKHFSLPLHFPCFGIQPHPHVNIVSVPDSLISDLKKLKLQKQKEKMAAGELWFKLDDEERIFLFSDYRGKPLNPTSVKNWWQRFIKRHGLKYINFHALRHTSATLLINQGVHAKVISERLGHSDIKTTMNIYGHVLQKADREAANKFDALLKKKEQA